jgi:hypothetical protein
MRITRYAFGTARPAPGLPNMESITQYLRFAEECRRMAREAKSEEHRKLLEEMAQAWEKVAKEADPTSSHLSI